MFCVFHKWRHIKDEEYYGKDTYYLTDFMTGENRPSKPPEGIISIVRCEKCGKIKHIKTQY